MQEVSNAFLNVLRSLNTTPTQLVPVVEFYSSDAVPTSGGFDPASSSFLFGVTTVAGIMFRGRVYKELAVSVGEIHRTIKKQLSGFSFSLANSTREVVDFEYAVGFEGLICVCRIIDRAASRAFPLHAPMYASTKSRCFWVSSFFICEAL
jgi:hypothetical protein